MRAFMKFGSLAVLVLLVVMAVDPAKCRLAESSTSSFIWRSGRCSYSFGPGRLCVGVKPSWGRGPA